MSHFTFCIPYQPGTTSRSGKPCWGGSGAPFISYASRASRGLGEREGSLVGLGLARLDAPIEAVKSSSLAVLLTPASSSSGARACRPTPRCPTASVSQGWLTGRGSSSARPLPAHSNVIGLSTRSRA